MDKKNSSKIGHNKKSLLNSPVEHIDIKSFDARKIIDGMGKMSFTSRDTAKAAGIFNREIHYIITMLISTAAPNGVARGSAATEIEMFWPFLWPPGGHF